MVHGDVETSEGFESASWSAVRENFGGVCCVCVSVWSVPAWELDSRGHGYDLVGVWVCGLYPRGNWTHVATGTAWLVCGLWSYPRGDWTHVTTGIKKNKK